MPVQDSKPQWGASYRLIAAEKWKAKSAVMGAEVTRALVEYARPSAGMAVLDLASGTGEPAISIAPLTLPGGHITALDLSAELLAVAEERARQRGLDNFSTLIASANELPFPEQDFDLITSRFGVMFFADTALREACRVLKPGARACFAAWGPFDQPYWSSMMGVVHKRVGGPLLPEDMNPFQYSRPGTLSAALRRAGFQAEEEIRTVPWTWPGTPEEVWEQAQAAATMFLPMLARISPADRESIDNEVLAAVRQYVEGDCVKFGATIVLASGTKV